MEARMPDGQGTRGALALLVEVDSRVAAISLEHVSETLRPLAVKPFPGAPPFILGVSVVRGEPVPVVDLGMILGEPPGSPRRRWVMLQVGERPAALAVGAVERILPWAALDRKALPPLLESAGHGALSEIASLDQEFLSVLQTAQLVPEEVWRRIAPHEVPR